MNVAVLTGGYSGERQISFNSAKVVINNLDPSRYNAVLITIDKGEWYYEDAQGIRIPVDRTDFSVVLNGRKLSFDAVFIALHGTPGEDGKLQGYLEMLDIPYTSCDSITSALTFDKFFTKQIVGSSGVFTAPSMVFNKFERVDIDKVADTIGFPCFVKPNCGGSSVGMSRVNNMDDLEIAISKAFQEDHRILIEKYIQGREFTCGVIRSGGEVVVFPVTEVLSKKEFFDFEAKYTPGMADEITPADIDTDLEIEIKATSSSLYRLLNCKGVVRFDYIAAPSGLCFLEVNTVPGLSEASIIPNMARVHGWDRQELFTRMLREAINSR